jgi:hypothetical protein
LGLEEYLWIICEVLLESYSGVEESESGVQLEYKMVIWWCLVAATLREFHVDCRQTPEKVQVNSRYEVYLDF